MTDVFGGCPFFVSTSVFYELSLSKKEDFSKRSMYGRANFDLLRQRVLYHPEKDKECGRKRTRNPAKKQNAGENAITSEHTTIRISEVA